MGIFKPSFYVPVLMATVFASAQQGTLQTAAAQINLIMQARAAEGNFSGSVLVAREGQIVYQHAFGFANLEWKAPNDLQTKFEIGSITC